MPTWKEPSILSHPTPIAQKGKQEARYSGIWLWSLTEKEVPHMGPLLCLDPCTCPKQVTGSSLSPHALMTCSLPHLAWGL